MLRPSAQFADMTGVCYKKSRGEKVDKWRGFFEDTEPEEKKRERDNPDLY